MTQATTNSTVISKRLSISQRFSDWLNPILVREVQQFAKGRMFLISILLTLVAILIIAIYGVSEHDLLNAEESGQQIFSICMAVFSVCSFLIIPMQVFQSMRKEVSSQTTELLLLSNMSPWKIVRGKLLSMGVFFLLYLSLFSPALALTLLLRGVDIQLISFSLLLAVIISFSFCCGGLFAGALCRFKAIEILVTILFTLVIVFFSISMVTTAGFQSILFRELPRIFRSSELLISVLTYLVQAILLGILYLIISASMLTHPYENRSTAFRVFFIIQFLISFSILLIQETSSSSLYRYSLAFVFHQYFFISFTLIQGIGFLFFTTESPILSIRVRNQVPKHPIGALLSIPWLPGAGRGMIFIFIFLLIKQLCYVGANILLHRSLFNDNEFTYQLVIAEYLIFYAGIAGLIRIKMTNEVRKNWFARLWGFLVLIVGLLISWMGSWFDSGLFSFMHLLNPYHSLKFISYSKDQAWMVLGPLSIACAIITILYVPSMIRSIQEVMKASKDRREKARQQQNVDTAIDVAADLDTNIKQQADVQTSQDTPSHAS